MRWLPLVLLALASAGGAWWLVRDTSSETRADLPSLPEAVTKRPRGADPGVPDPLDSHPDPARLRREEVVAPALAPGSGPKREAVQRGEIEVRVVLAETGAPVPQASVTFLDRQANPDWTRSWSEPGQRKQFLLKNGRTLLADAEGRVRVPETESGVLTSRLVGYHGILEWATLPSAGAVLELEPEVDLRVRVLDDGGRPRSGVEVVLMRDRGGAPAPVLKRRSSGADAIATFPRIRQLIGDPASPSRFTITFGFPCMDPPRIELDGDVALDETIDLRMPATGRVVVRVLDETGGPLKEVANATLGPSLDPSGRPIQYSATPMRIVGGRATFPFVGVGSTFEVRLDGSRDRPPLKDVGRGPNRPGEEREIVLSWEERHPVLVGRAVSATGEPLVQRRGRFQIRRGTRAYAGPTLTTDGSGAFRIVIDASRGPVVGAVVEASLYSARGEAPLETSIPLDRMLGGGETAIGDVRFLPQPELVSGQVVDPSGTPLFGVHVRAEVEDDEGDWEPQRELAATTDRDGRFTIHGRHAAPRLKVVAVRQGYEEARGGPVAIGASGLRLVLHPRGGR